MENPSRVRWITAIESVIDAVGRLTLWLALAMIALVAVNVILRYSLSVGSVWAQEMEWHLLALLILLGLCYALQRGENVRVDVFYARFSPSTSFSSACRSTGPRRCTIAIAVIAATSRRLPR